MPNMVTQTKAMTVISSVKEKDWLNIRATTLMKFMMDMKASRMTMQPSSK